MSIAEWIVAVVVVVALLFGGLIVRYERVPTDANEDDPPEWP